MQLSVNIGRNHCFRYNISIVRLASTFSLPLLPHVSGAEVWCCGEQFFPAPGVCHETVDHSQWYQDDGREEKEPTERLYFERELIIIPVSRNKVDKREHQNHLRKERKSSEVTFFVVADFISMIYLTIKVT